MNKVIKYLEERLIPDNDFEKIGHRSFFYKDKIDTIFVFVGIEQVTILHDGDFVVSNETQMDLTDPEDIYQTILERF